jgi:hypothetical protein
MTTTTRFHVGCLLLPLLAALGCSGSNRAAVAGKVTFDGQPLKEGRIMFVPDQANPGPTAGAQIVNGNYSVPAANGVFIGKNVVQINAVRKTGKMIQSPFGPGLIDEVAEFVPAKYNKKTEISCEIKPGNNHFDFDLTSR